MSKATGYTCDRKECSKFEVGEALPQGWLVLRVNVGTNAGAAIAATTFELCSNFCLATLATERAAADGTPVGGSDKSGRRFRSPEALLAAQMNGRHTAHKKFHIGKGVVNPDCSFCQEITEPIPA